MCTKFDYSEVSLYSYSIFYQASIKTIDHVELLKEQLKILAGEVALHSSVLKRLSDEAAKNPKNEQIQVIFFLPFILLEKIMCKMRIVELMWYY